MIRHIAGFEPERASKSVLRFHRGSVASIDGSELFEFPTAVDVDTAATGANGMAYCGFGSGGDYFPYVIRNDLTDETSVTLSNQISTSLVVLPSTDWRVVRKLPWGFVAINGAYIPGGTSGVPEIPTFHISHWPKPFTLLTQATTQSNFSKVAASATSTGWSSFSCAKVLPDNARVVDILVQITGSGSAYLRSGTHQDDGIRVDTGQMVIPTRVRSDRTIEFKTTGSAVLNAWVLGYHNTEPS